MGGYGSGRTSNRSTVDGSISLNVNSLVRKGLLTLGARGSGTLKWSRVSDGKETASCHYAFNTTSEPMRVFVSYTYAGSMEMTCNVMLEAIRPYFGGKRLYLICPECGRRRWYLYLRRFVKCRKCHNLTYRSCNESHGSDRFYASMAKGLGCKMEDVRRAMSFYIRQGRKERERKERLSRRGRKRKSQ